MKRFPVAGFSTAAALLILGAVWLSREGPITPQRIQTSSGQFELIAVTRRGEEFASGSLLERLLDPSIPKRGGRIGPLQLRKPERIEEWDNADLTAWMLYRGTNIQGPTLLGARVFAENLAGRRLENPPPTVRSLRVKESLISVPLFAFPRDENRIQLLFSPPAQGAAAREWVHFIIQNPFRGKRASWSPEQLPSTKPVEGRTITLNSLSLDPIIARFDTPGPGWRMRHCFIQDSEGNRRDASTLFSPRSKTKAQARFAMPLETNLNWRVQAGFVLTTNSSSDPTFTLRLPSNGPPVPITNRLGGIHHCFFTGGLLEIVAPPGEDAPNWIILTATNLDNGSAMELPTSLQSLGEPRGRVTMYLLRSDCANITLQLADPTTFTAEWYIDPSRAPRTIPDKDF